MRSVTIQNKTRKIKKPIQAKVYDTFLTRFRGLMFTPSIEKNEGVLLVEPADNRVNTTIHMFFMNYDIGVLWINSQGIIVDQTLAKRWRPYYAPQAPAKYTLETHPDQLKQYRTGDKIELIYADK